MKADMSTAVVLGDGPNLPVVSRFKNMLTLRKGHDRGRTQIGWLDSYHTFSFGHYHDPKHHQFRTLRVLNEDRVTAGGGFDTHPHRDMEILSYVLSGELGHRDSLGHGASIAPGEWQYMSAGTGIAHSEFNPSPDVPCHFFQMWIVPQSRGLIPRYEQKSFAQATRNSWQLVASPDGRDGSISIRQDAFVLSAKLDAGMQLQREFAIDRAGWLHVVQGKVTVNGRTLNGGDAVAIEEELLLVLQATTDAEVILFDLQ